MNRTPFPPPQLPGVAELSLGCEAGVLDCRFRPQTGLAVVDGGAMMTRSEDEDEEERGEERVLYLLNVVIEQKWRA